MTTSPLSRSSFVESALLALALVTMVLLGLRTISTMDLWMHLAAGRHVAEQGVASVDPFSFGLPDETPWRQTSWLYDWTVFQLWQLGGAPLTVVTHALLVAGAFLLMTRALRRVVPDGCIGWSILLCAWLIAPVFVPQARVISLFFIGLFIGMLARPPLRPVTIILLVLAQIAWTNMHILFVFGPVVALFALIEALMDRRRRETPAGGVAARAVLLVASLLATLVNPFGPGVWREVFERITQYKQMVLLEWISPFHQDMLPLAFSQLSMVALVIVAVTFIFRRERLPVMITCCAVLGAFMLVRAGRAPDVAALLIFPFAALGFQTAGALLARGAERGRGIGWAALGVILLVSVFFIVTNRYYIASGSASSFGWRVNTPSFPVVALDILAKKNAVPDRMINLAHDGGYLAWARPDAKVYADPRGGLYGAAFFARQAMALGGQKDREGAIIPLPDVDAILLNATWPGTRASMIYLLTDNQWAVAYFDGTSVLMLRRNEANKPLLLDEELSRAGLASIQDDYAGYKKALNHRFARPGNPARLIGAAAIYQILGRFDESLALLELITQGSPRMASAWVNRGIAELTLKKTSQSIATLEHAAELLPDFPLPWLWLSKAYAQDGRTDEAAKAKDRARSINPKAVELFEAQVK